MRAIDLFGLLIPLGLAVAMAVLRLKADDDIAELKKLEDWAPTDQLELERLLRVKRIRTTGIFIALLWALFLAISDYSAWG